MQQNKMKLEFDSLSVNEAFARVAVAAFMTQMNPTMEEISDVKTAVSEAVTNSIIHGYEGKNGRIIVRCQIMEGQFLLEVEDYGRGIADIDLARQPLYTTKAECDRAGMGFTFMEAFMDSLEVSSQKGKGTLVCMKKQLSSANREKNEERRKSGE